MCHIFFIHSSVDGHLGCFHVLAIVNSAAVNIGVHVSFLIRVFIFSGYMPRNGMLEIHTIFNPCFADEETEAQRGEVRCLRSNSS